MCDLDGGRDRQRRLSLRLRCLSEAAVASDEDDEDVAAAAPVDSANFLRSLSETCLANDGDADGGRVELRLLHRDPYLQPALIATNVDDDDDGAGGEDGVAESGENAAAEEELRCNCGCGVALKTSPVDDPDDYEDEGCYLGRRRRRRLTSGSSSSERQQKAGAGDEDNETGSSSSSDPPSTASSSAAATLNPTGKAGEKPGGSSASSSSSPSSTSSAAFDNCKDASADGGRGGGGGGDSGGTGRRSFSSSVDSGRSSDTGTLGGSESDGSVKIVSHSFCDVLGVEKATATSGEGTHTSEDAVANRLAAPQQKPEMPTIVSMGGGGNKVAVFVPFSAISEYKNDAAARQAERRRLQREAGGGSGGTTHSVTDVFADNVVICDTQVILRINCTPNDIQLNEEEEEEGGTKVKKVGNSRNEKSELSGVGEEPEKTEAEIERRKPLPVVSAEKLNKLKKSRMSRRMTTTVAVYEMVNAARKCKQDALEEEEGEEEEYEEEGEEMARAAGHEDSLSRRDAPGRTSGSRSRSSSANRSPKKAPPPTPRRKDLCKLLGLIECDVTTDATSPEDIKVAQKVAIDNLLTAIKENQSKSEENKSAETSMKVGGETATLVRPQVAKKDLAKFLGIDEERVDGSPLTNPNQKSNQQPHPEPQRQKKKSLVNWSQIMKQSMSMRWRPPADESPARSREKKSNATQLSHGLDFELPVQLKRVNEVLDCPPEAEVVVAPGAGAMTESAKAASGHRRKNLSKFLGMDDSDSEEMVFIQNRRSCHGKGGGEGDDYGNSLNRSDQGSSIVGIRIVNADDLAFSSKSVVECAADRTSSSYSSSPSSTISSRDSTQRSSKSSNAAINGFLRRSAYATSQQRQRQARPGAPRSSSLPHSAEDRNSSMGSSSRLAPSRGEEMTFDNRDDAAASGDSSAAAAAAGDTEFSPPPRKNVVFKEYSNFCVEESIALGLPIIPSGQVTAASGVGTRGRKKKKEAARRSAEVVGAENSGTSHKQPQQQYFFSSTAASLARGKSGAHGKTASKKNSLEAYLQSSNHDWLLEPPQQEGAALNTAGRGGKQRVARNTVVRGSEPVYLDMFRHRQMVAAAATHQYCHNQQHRAFHHHGHHHHHSHHLFNGALPRYLSCSPKGRVRAVKQRAYQNRQQEQQHPHQRRLQQPDYFDELDKVLQA